MSTKRWAVTLILGMLVAALVACQGPGGTAPGAPSVATQTPAA